VQVRFNIISVLQLSYLDLLFPSTKIIQNFLSFKKHRLFHLLALVHSGLGVRDQEVQNCLSRRRALRSFVDDDYDVDNL
jgi:hypothetical protein